MAMDVKVEKFDGRKYGTLEKIAVANSHGCSFAAIPLGATLLSFSMPDTHGRVENITLSYQNPEDYFENPHYFGATVGRFANRISNGKFRLGGREYILSKNEGKHHLHGGVKGFSRVLWHAEPFDGADAAGVKFSYISPDGEESYPGNLDVSVTLKLNERNELFFMYAAGTDKKTPVNLTNHAYWNLKGAGKGTILDHRLKLNCSRYLPTTDELVPKGDILSVRGTPMDFTAEKRIGEDIQATGTGYDHCFVIEETAPSDAGNLKLAARVVDPLGGRCMIVYTDQPGVQLYTGNFLDHVKGAEDVLYERHHGVCLETQNFPDAVNHPHFPDPFLKPDQTYETTTMHRFLLL
jgi:aldose 1-epimerase